jgi:hypothetical protein
LQGSQGDKGRPVYTATLEQNLFEPLDAESLGDYNHGDGGELRGKDRHPGKMQALHSSSALSSNVFHYWRRTGRAAAIARACGLPSTGHVSLSFEQHFPIDTTQFRRAPNLDAAFRYDTGALDLVGVESKFCEPFSTRTHAGLSPAYLTPECDAFWRGWDALRGLAERMSPDNTEFEHLDAPQLLKHLLGLRRDSTRGFRLVYLYNDAPGPVAAQHTVEVEQFVAVAAQDEVSVVPLTYQDVIARLMRAGGTEDAAYLNYITERYL